MGPLGLGCLGKGGGGGHGGADSGRPGHGLLQGLRNAWGVRRGIGAAEALASPAAERASRARSPPRRRTPAPAMQRRPPPPTGRHWYALITGLALIYYPFGTSVLHALVPSTLIYLAMRAVPSHCGTLAWLIAFPYLIFKCACVCVCVSVERGWDVLAKPAGLGSGTNGRRGLWGPGDGGSVAMTGGAMGRAASPLAVQARRHQQCPLFDERTTHRALTLCSHVTQASGLAWKAGQLDFTGAQMVLTLKLIAIGMCVQDGAKHDTKMVCVGGVGRGLRGLARKGGL